MSLEEMEQGIRMFLESADLFDNINKEEHLKDTPERVARAWSETFLYGYSIDPVDLLTTQFDSKDLDEMIILKDINFCSMCAHHLLPFTGTVKIGYVPSKKIIGISKLARVVEAFSRRLSVQEALTTSIAEAINNALKPIGVGVVIEAQHTCVTVRGVQKPNAKMITSCLLGKMREEREMREEFLRF